MPLRISFIHLQAAPSGVDSFIPATEAYLRPRRLDAGQSAIIPTFRLYYNAKDWMTWLGKSAVGRKDSCAWVEQVKAFGNNVFGHAYAAQYRFKDDAGAHYRIFDKDWYSRDPGQHEQRGVLEWYSYAGFADRWEPDCDGKYQ